MGLFLGSLFCSIDLLNTVVTVYDRSTANIVLHSEKLKTYSLGIRNNESGIKQGCPLSPLLCNIVLDMEFRREEIKGTQTRKEEVKLSLFVDDMILYTESPKDYIKNY